VPEIISPTVQRDPAKIGPSERVPKLLRQGSRLLNLVAIAKGQKVLLWIVLGQIAMTVVLAATSAQAPMVAMAGSILYLAMAVTTIVFVGRLAHLCGYNIVIVIISSLCMVIPLIGLILVLSVNSKATTLLRLTGARVGLMGVSAKEMEKLYEGSCINCGYCVRDLKSDRCPECGTLIEVSRFA
jgi:hypothetical protein